MCLIVESGLVKAIRAEHHDLVIALVDVRLLEILSKVLGSLWAWYLQIVTDPIMLSFVFRRRL